MNIHILAFTLWHTKCQTEVSLAYIHTQLQHSGELCAKLGFFPR